MHLRSTEARDWKDVVGSLVARLARELAMQGAEIAHLKLLAQTQAGAVRANVTRGGETPSLEGDLPPSHTAALLINARVHLPPDQLRAVVERALAGLQGVQVEIRQLDCFAPAPPQPRHRYSKSV